MADDAELRRELAEVKARIAVIEEFLRLAGVRIPVPQPVHPVIGNDRQPAPAGGNTSDGSRVVVRPDGSRYVLTEEQAAAMWASVRGAVGHGDVEGG